MTLEFLLVPSSSHVCKIYYHWYRNTDWVGKVVTKIHKKIISGSIFIFCSAVCCSTEVRKHQIEFFSLTFFSFFLIFLYAFFLFLPWWENTRRRFSIFFTFYYFMSVRKKNLKMRENWKENEGNLVMLWSCCFFLME